MDLYPLYYKCLVCFIYALVISVCSLEFISSTSMVLYAYQYRKNNLFLFLDIWGNYPVKYQYVLSDNSCPSTMYGMMSVVLGGIYSCFDVTSTVLEVLYALKILECKILLFLLIRPFNSMIDYGQYLRTESAINTTHVGKYPFSLDLILKKMESTCIDSNTGLSMPWI